MCLLREEEERICPLVVFMETPPVIGSFGESAQVKPPSQMDDLLAAVFVECMTCAPWPQIIGPGTLIGHLTEVWKFLIRFLR